MISGLRSRILIILILVGLTLILNPTPGPRVFANSLQTLQFAIESDRYDEALVLSRELQLAYPEQVHFYLLSLDLALRQGQVELVEQLVGSASEYDLNEEDLNCYLYRARFSQANLQSKTEQLINEPFDCLPDRQLMSTVFTLMEKGDVKTAQQVASELDPDALLTPIDHFHLGLLTVVHSPLQALASLQLYLDTQEDPDLIAEELILTIHQAALESSEAYTFVQVGLTLISHGKWDLAVESFHSATLLEPEFPEAWAYLGLALDRSGEDGYPMLAKATVLDPQSPLIHFLMAKHWNQLGKFDLAIQELEKAYDLDPENPAIAADLGEAKLAAGDLIQAQEHFLNAAQSSGNNTEFWLLLADFSFRTETEIQPLGLEATRTAWFLDASESAVYDRMGYGYYLLGEYDLSDRFLSLGIQLDPTYPELQYHYGLLQLSKGEVRVARGALEYAVSLDPQGSIGRLAARTLSWIPED